MFGDVTEEREDDCANDSNAATSSAGGRVMFKKERAHGVSDLLN